MTQEVVVFGPGDMATAHKSGEFAPIAELNQCVGYLETSIRSLCIVDQGAMK